MEVHNACNINTKGGMLPTRLQKHAPASLRLDQLTSTAATIPFLDASKAIPLLSPVVIESPTPMPETMEKDGNQGTSRSSSTAPEPLFQGAAGWQHPAVSAFVDPSSLLTVFQSQCMIANRAQWGLRVGLRSIFSSWIGQFNFWCREGPTALFSTEYAQIKH